MAEDPPSLSVGQPGLGVPEIWPVNGGYEVRGYYPYKFDEMAHDTNTCVAIACCLSRTLPIEPLYFFFKPP
jgi:hypothetical protein